METTKYVHHGQNVSVQTNLKGLHRQHCLCYGCKLFEPGKGINCIFAQHLYEGLIDKNNPIVVAPVWECEDFEFEKGKRETFLNK